MKGRIAVCLLAFMLAPVNAGSLSGDTHLNVPFKSVKISGSSECSVYFKNVTINNELISIAVELDNVEVALTKTGDTEIITTLDVFGTRSGGTYDWLKAERVVVSVRSEEDLSLWNNFLGKARKRREVGRKRLNQPTRILPPENISP